MSAAQTPRGRRLSSEARGMLPWCVALSAALHVLLLAAMAPAGPRAGGPARHAGARAAARPVSVRLVPEPSPLPRQQVAPEPGRDADGMQRTTIVVAAAASENASASRPAASAPASVTAVAPASAAASASAPVSAPALAAAPEPQADALAKATASTPDGAADGGYVPRPLLSVVPDAIDPVIIPTVPGTDDGGRHVGVLALYIDEQGRVRRIEAEQPALPEAMERAARDAFMAARFSPGQVDGHVVRSRIYVEVVFDDGPLPERPAAVGASGASAASATSGAPTVGAASAARGASTASAASAASAARAASAQRSR